MFISGALSPRQVVPTLSQRHLYQFVTLFSHQVTIHVASAAAATTGGQNPLSGPAVTGHYHQWPVQAKSPNRTRAVGLSKVQFSHFPETHTQTLPRTTPQTSLAASSRPCLPLQSGQRRRQALRGAPWDRTDWPARESGAGSQLVPYVLYVSFFRRSLASGGDGGLGGGKRLRYPPGPPQR